MNEMLLIIKLAAKPLKNPFAHIKSAAMLIFSKSMFKFDVCYFKFFCFDFNLMLTNMNLR